jgi:hypothetical protein
LIGWGPLAVLVAIQALALSSDRAGLLLLDFAVHARFLIAAPLFILAESVCIPRLGRTVRHFLDAGLVAVDVSCADVEPLELQPQGTSTSPLI